jgi:hypothetical protein
VNTNQRALEDTMPQLTRVLTTEDLSRANRPSGLDLSEYTRMIEQVQAEGGVGGVLVVGDEESQRTAKRRLSLAAKASGCTLIWRKSVPGELRFVLAVPGEPVPGSRQRRAPTDVQPEQAIIDAVLTDDVAAVTETIPNAAATADAPASPARRRRKPA